MAFINERLTDLQREDFARRNITDPLQQNQLFVSYFWTADFERNAFLANVGSYHDLPEETLFIFIFNQGIYLFKLEMRDIDCKTKEWNLLDFKPLNDTTEADRCLLISLFKEALAEYKYNGLPRKCSQQFNMKINF